MPTATTPGVDLSDNNGTVSHTSIPSDVVFEYVKATQGARFDAHTYAANTAGARAAGKLVGAYHFADLNGSAVEQATHFAHAVGKPGSGHLDPVLDFEGELLASFERRQDIKGAVAWIRAFTSTVDRLTGRRCGIYLSDATVTWLGGWWPSLSAGRWQWIARLGKAPAHPCHAWQHSWTGRVPGIAGDVDLDQFNGTVADLRKWAKLDAARPRTLKLTSPLMHGNDVLKLQHKLIDHGYHLTADSVFGPKTSAAVAAFKKTVKWLPHNAIVGAGTRKALGL